MQTPGEILAAARKKRELTVAEVAGLTKIPEALVAAVEADEYHKLSGPLYVRSFMRTIAQAVGEDPRRVLDLYTEMAGGESAAAAAPGSPVWEAEEVVVQRLRASWQPWVTGAAGVILFLVLILLVARGCGSKEKSSPQTKAPVAADVDSLAAVPAPGAADTQEADGPAKDPATPVTVPCPGAADLTFASGQGDLTLLVRLSSPLDIRVRVDGQHDFVSAEWPEADEAAPAYPGGPLEPGRVYRCRDGFLAAWRADDHFGLKLGRVEGVEVLLQDRPCSLAGLRPGQEIILDRHSVGL